VAAKDRLQELQRPLKNIKVQSYKPDKVVIVSSGKQVLRRIMEDFPSMNIKYLRCIPPPGAKHHNMGIIEADLK